MNKNLFQALRKTGVPGVLSVLPSEKSINTGLAEEHLFREPGNSEVFQGVPLIENCFTGTPGTPAKNGVLQEVFRQECSSHAGLRRIGTPEHLEHQKNSNVEKNSNEGKKTELKRLLIEVADLYGGDDMDHIDYCFKHIIDNNNLDDALIALRESVKVKPPFKVKKSLPGDAL